MFLRHLVRYIIVSEFLREVIYSSIQFCILNLCKSVTEISKLKYLILPFIIRSSLNVISKHLITKALKAFIERQVNLKYILHWCLCLMQSIPYACVAHAKACRRDGQNRDNGVKWNLKLISHKTREFLLCLKFNVPNSQ